MAVEIGPALGLTADSSSLVVATGDLKNIASAAAGAQVAADKLVVGTKAVSGGMSKVAYQSRMVAQQLSQVGQQTMATGNFVQALAIQLPDMALGFGAVGIAAGVVSGVALPLVAQWLGGTTEKAISLSDAMGNLEKSFSTYQSYAKTAATSTTELSIEFGKFAGQVQGFSAYMAEVQLGQTFDDLRATIDPLKSSLSEVEAQMKNVALIHDSMLRIPESDLEALFQAKEAMALFQDKADAAAAKVGLTVDQAASLAAAMDQIKATDSMGEVASSAGRALAIILQIYPEGQKLPPTLRESVAALRQMVNESGKAATTIGKISSAADQIAAAARAAATAVAGIGSAAQGAYGSVAALASKLWEAASAQAAARSAATDKYAPNGAGGLVDKSKLYAGMSGRGQPSTPASTGFALPAGWDAPSSSGSAGGGSGGGGGSSDRQTSLDALIQSLQTERETVEAWHAEQLASLATFSDAELAAIGGTNEAKIRLEAEYQERLRGLKSGYQGDALSQASTFFGQLQDATQSGTDGMLRISRVAGAAEALINAYVAGSLVLRDPKLSWWQKIPAAFSIIGAGMGMANAIKGGSKSSGSGAAAASSGGSPSGQQSTTTETPLRVSLDAIDPSASYTGAAIQKMFEAIQKEAGNRGIVWVADGMSA